MESRVRVVRKIAVAASGFVLMATAGIGLLHTKAFHPLLMKLAGTMGCPMGQATAAEVESTRRSVVVRERGVALAPSRPALGFDLDKTTVDDVRAWEQRTGASCTEVREATLVKCSNLSASAVGRPSWEDAITELSFGFTPQGRLVSVTTLYSHRTAEETANIVDEARGHLQRDLGPAHSQAGSLAQKGSVATISYRYRDYAVDVTACPVPGSGHVVRELYASML